MAVARLCPQCSAWMCAADDAWCGYCGEPCAQLEMVIKPSIFLVGHIPPKLSVRFTNPTCASLTTEPLTAPEWISMEGEHVRSLAPGESCLLWGSAKTFPLSEPQFGEIRVKTSIGEAASPVMVIEEQPRMVCAPPELEIWAGSARQRIFLWIAPKAGQLTIRGLSRGPSGGLTVVSKLDEPFVASLENPLAVQLEAEADLLSRQTSTSLLLEYESPHGARRFELPFLTVERSAPDLVWVGEHKPPERLFLSSQQQLTFVLRNGGADSRDGGRNNARLVIESVSLLPAPGCGSAGVQLMTKLPIELRGGDECTVVFDLNLESVPAQKRDVTHFVLEVQSNAPWLQRPVPLILQPLPEFDGVLAIDFGSSNTTCAAVETGCDLEHIKLDGEKSLSPTYIRYLDMSGPEPDTRIGSEVKLLASLDETVAASTIRGLKQQLGEMSQDIPVRPENSDRWTTRKANLAAADYLHEVRRIAESRKKAVFTEFILTHPAVCSLTQFFNLRTSIYAAFGTGKSTIHFLQEPIAALVPFLVKMVDQHHGPGYTVASFDMGGGTTDIAVLRVHHHWREHGAVEIRPEIVSCRGIRFGGEDLTDFLEQRLGEYCDQFLAEEEQPVVRVHANMKGVSSAAIRRNAAALREAAEKLKASMSQEGNVAAPEDIRLVVFSPERQTVQTRTLDFDDFPSSAGAELRAEFEEFARQKLRGLAEMLTTCAQRVEWLDYIHLSGKTAFLPIVQETLQERFGSVKIERAPDPKECVVTGACLSISLRRGTQRRLVLPPGFGRTTSSLGVFDVDARRFTAILPVDRPIPADGLHGELQEYWYGDESVSIWENLGLSDEDVERALAEKLLYKIGTWKPERTVQIGDGAAWTLRLSLHQYELTVCAVGHHGEIIPFRQVGSPGRI